MQLVVDIGNTRVKIGIFDQHKPVKTHVFNSIKDFIQSANFKDFEINNAIVCSVVDNINPLIEEISSFYETILFKADTPIPLKNLYTSQATLGSDRLAASIGAFTSFPNKNVLVIDAGTCLKYNFTNQNNEYLGGAISPGLQMRFKALNNYTARLPLLQADKDFFKLIGTNTNESILAGVQTAMIKEIDGFIDDYKSNYDNLTVVLTGGDADFFEKRLKNSIFADPFLILKGLNNILLHNLGKA